MSQRMSLRIMMIDWLNPEGTSMVAKVEIVKRRSAREPNDLSVILQLCVIMPSAYEFDEDKTRRTSLCPPWIPMLLF